MGFTAKRPKLDEDRISNLPSSVIGYILSFLPTKDAVATSVLSTTWKDFWTLVTNLSIDDDFIFSRPEDDNNSERLKAEFVDFVYWVLLVGRFSGLKKFHLHCKQSYIGSSVNEWISYVLKTNSVQELDINVPMGSSVVLPINLFTCRTLVKLELRGVHMSVPGLVCLPCVKHVYLFDLKLSDDDSITRLLNGCHVLDNLELHTCMGKSVRVITISVPSLTSLHLETLNFEEDVPEFHIVLDTPSLSDIFIFDRVHKGYVFGNLHHLKKARIILCHRSGRGVYPTVPLDDIHRVAVVDLLQSISKVQKLDFHTMDIDHRRELPTFENLTELEYYNHWNVTFNLLQKFLEKSPQLRVLRAHCRHADEHVAEDFERIDDSSLDWDRSQCIPKCFLSHLKNVHIIRFEGLNEEVELVKYFLKNARVLEKLTVWRSIKYKDESLKAVDLLKIFPRASAVCQMEAY